MQKRFLCFTLFSAIIASAQPFSLELLPTAGAGASSGDEYELQGVVSFLHPARLAGGTFVLETNPFSEPGTPVPTDTELLISYANGQVTLLWERSAAGFVLESTGSLDGSTPWITVDSQPQSNATHFFISLPAPIDDQFFRLRRQ